jgi:hypothetical protein
MCCESWLNNKNVSSGTKLKIGMVAPCGDHFYFLYQAPVSPATGHQVTRRQGVRRGVREQTSPKLLHFRGMAGAVPPLDIDFVTEELMDILAAIKREERKLEKELAKLRHKLDGVRAAGKA